MMEFSKTRHFCLFSFFVNYIFICRYEGLLEPRNRQLETVFEQAIKEATSDPTFNKVKRMSYSNNAGGDVSFTAI